MSLEARNFDEPDETVKYPYGRVALVNVGALTIGRETADPGWHWAEHIKPIAGTDWCEFHHVLYVMSGRMRVHMRGGDTRDFGPGVVADVPPGHDAWVVGDEPAVFLDIIGGVGFGRPETGERMLTTLLFTDVVGSTSILERLGDAGWKRLLTSHDEDVRTLMATHRGHVVKTTGDGFLATFDSPGRAIQCAFDVATSARNLGFQVRAGIHTGEVEFLDGDLRGLAVHLAARIMDAAAPGQVAVSSTTRELVAGAAIEFADLGPRRFKGINEERQIYEARPASTG